jgi:PAS domain S-box-containing protein
MADLSACLYLEKLGWAIGLFDLAGAPLQASPALEALLGGPADGGLMPVLATLLGADSAAHVAGRSRAGRSHFLFRHPARGICRLILRETEGRLVLVVFPLQEEGERLVISEILAEMVEQAPEPVGIMDAGRRLRYANRSGRQLLGLPESGPLEALPPGAIYPEGIGGLAPVEALALGATPVNVVSRVRNVSTGAVATIGQTLLLHDHVLLGESFFSAIAREAATEGEGDEDGPLEALVRAQRRLIKENTAKLHYSWEAWRSFVECNPALVLLTDARGEIRFCNRGFLGGSALPLIGLNLFEALAPPALAPALRALAARVATGEPPNEALEGECLLPDGRRLFCHWQAGHLRRDDGAGLTWVLTDLSREHAARERAQAMEKFAATGRMAARIAHEFNNPLAGIRNALALVRMDLPSSAPALRYLDMVDGEIDRLAGIIRQMYGLYKPEGSAPTAIDVPALVAASVFLMQPVGAALGVRVEAGEVPALTVHLPEPYLREILYNLIRNAVEASPRGGEVTVHARQEGRYLRIMVDDRGHGLPAEGDSRLFEPFFTTKATFQGAGLGLGLSVCKGLAEAMGGCVGLVRRQGGGVSAILAVPLAPADAG